MTAILDARALGCATATRLVPQLRHYRNAEPEHILRVLEQTGLVVGGPHGAAALLGLERTSLSVMRRLGIVRPQLRSGDPSAEAGTPSQRSG